VCYERKSKLSGRGNKAVMRFNKKMIGTSILVG
jgi:hypothetical protein